MDLIWARYKIADVQAGLPESKETAGKELTRLVSQFGVAHSAGVSIAERLKDLGLGEDQRGHVPLSFTSIHQGY